MLVIVQVGPLQTNQIHRGLVEGVCVYMCVCVCVCVCV